MAERNPQDSDLASQPALSRFENSVTPAMLMRLIEFQITTGVERLLQDHGGALPDEALLNIDPTDDATHWRQQLTLFHGYYNQHHRRRGLSTGFTGFLQIIREPTT